MKKLLKNILVLSFSILTVNAGSIATVDEQKVLSEYVAFNQAREKVLASVAPIFFAKSKQYEARSKLIEYQTTLQNKQVQLQQFSQQAQELGQNGQQQELVPLQQKAQDAVEEIAKKEGIDIVLSQTTVIYVEDALDISDKVIDLLNK